MKIQYKILPTNYVLNNNCNGLKKAAVIVHLFYDDKIEHSFSYIRNIPREVDVYIVTANVKLKDRAAEIIRKEELVNITVLEKPNRGRDYAALFVTSKDVLAKYEYVCFVHDKKSHKGDVTEIGELWEECLFKCTLASEQYIKNVIDSFEADAQLGLLSAIVSPEKYLLGIDGKLWTINYTKTIELLVKLGLRNLPSIEDNPLYVGSAFWFRTKAINKLINLDLEYKDFPEEPMSLDGTLAHAIERSFGFVVEDEGYTSSYVVPIDYAEYTLSHKTTQLTQAMNLIRESEMLAFKRNKVVFDIADSLLSEDTSPLLRYCLRYQRVFIFVDSESNEQKDDCISILNENGIIVGAVYNTVPIEDTAIIRKSNNGLIVCAKRDNEKAYVEYIARFGREPFVV